MTTAGHIAKAITDINAERENQDWVETALDEVGVGGGVLDRLLELGYDVVGLNAGSPAYDSERFANAKAEWYWMVRDLFEAGEIDIDRVLELIAKRGRALVQATGVLILLPEGDDLVVRAAAGRGGDDLLGSRLPATVTGVGDVVY
jgi:hypothetical protein